MLRHTISKLKLLPVLALLLTPIAYATDSADLPELKKTVDRVILPVMQKNHIPGMTVGITIDGKGYIYHYGLASKETKRPVNDSTLFEVGSISKTVAATLTSYAQVNGKLSLSDNTSQYLPELKGSRFDDISLLNLATHTSGLPLFIPDTIKTTSQLMDYLKQWQPTHEVGSQRVYSNMGIGTLGMIAADSMDQPYETIIEKKIFPMLGMTHSYLNVPLSQMKNYAQGYSKQDAPARLNKELLWAEGYGIKTNAADLLRFLEANMQVGVNIDEKLQQAITNTHTGYFKSGDMTQDLMWEQYAYPVTLEKLLAGNSAETMDTKTSQLSPVLQPASDVFINKTGSTNGFAAYAAFIPAKKVGIVILANKNYSIDQRVTAAYQILTALDKQK